MRSFQPICFFLVLMCFGAGCAAPGPVPSHRPEAGPTWIFFGSKEVDPDALHRAEQLLAPEARSRRGRNRKDGSVVDMRDLPVTQGAVASLEEMGFKIRTKSRWLNAVSVEEGFGNWEDLRRLPGVREVQAVGSMERMPGWSPWGGRSTVSGREENEGTLVSELETLDVDLVHAAGFFGSGVRVAVIDTGFSLEHPALLGAQARVVGSWDFLQDDSVVSNEGAEEELARQDTHGTAVLGPLTGGEASGYLGVAPMIELLLAKSESVEDEAPYEEDLWIAAVEWAEQQGASVVTSSLGWSDWIDPSDLDGETAVSSSFASSFAEATGILLVQSIGNSGPDPGSLVAPSDSSGILSVGALQGSGEIAEFSGRGPTVDGRDKPELVAPGVEVAVPLSGEEGFASLSGTSLAAPMVAGVAALALEANPEWTLAELRAALLASGTQSAAPDSIRGWGLPSAWQVCGLPCSCEDLDEDGAWAESCGGDDCNDEDPSVGPGFPEVPYDGLDQDCDGLDLDDMDGDGFLGGPSGTDCGDSNPAVFPSPVTDDGSVAPVGGHELCADGWDNDCDGLFNLADPDCTSDNAPSSGGSSSASTASSGIGCALGPSVHTEEARRLVQRWSLLCLALLLLRRRVAAAGSRPSRWE